MGRGQKPSDAVARRTARNDGFRDGKAGREPERRNDPEYMAGWRAARRLAELAEDERG